MMSELNLGLLDEIEALKAILMDEVLVKTDESDRPVAVEMVVFPSTADNALEQYVCVTLEIELPSGYPDLMPIVRLRNPRGLDDSVITKIKDDVRAKCESLDGQPIIYELIELVRDHLTASNLPSCQCAICLYGFREGDFFTKTECYHYFHSHCLACHVTSTERIYLEEQEKLPAWQREAKGSIQVVCPVCREAISCDMSLLKSANPPLDVESAHGFEPTAELRLLQQKMASLFSHQKAQGGIIDLDANDTKLLLVTASEEVVPGPSPRPVQELTNAQAPRHGGRGGHRPRGRYKTSRTHTNR